MSGPTYDPNLAMMQGAQQRQMVFGEGPRPNPALGGGPENQRFFKEVNMGQAFSMSHFNVMQKPMAGLNVMAAKKAPGMVEKFMKETGLNEIPLLGHEVNFFDRADTISQSGHGQIYGASNPTDSGGGNGGISEQVFGPSMSILQNGVWFMGGVSNEMLGQLTPPAEFSQSRAVGKGKGGFGLG